MNFPAPHVRPVSEFSKSMRAQIHAALVDARTRLWNGALPKPSDKQEYICYCLPGDRLEFPGAEWASAVISDRLYPRSFFSTWATRELGGYRPESEQMQAMRLQWLDSLIAEFAPVHQPTEEITHA